MPNIPRDTGLDSTWAFLRDPYRFIFARSQFHQSPVFQTRLMCSGQPIPDSGLSLSSATAGGSPSLN